MTLYSPGAPNPEGLASAAQARVFEALPEAQSAFFAPGRVNLMGDHIDYLGGVVLPMSLTEGTVLAAVPKAPGAEAGLEVWALDASEKALLSSKDGSCLCAACAGILRASSPDRLPEYSDL